MARHPDKLFIFAAPSGAGKSTLMRIMLQKYDHFQFSVSITTRTPRPNEIDGQHYYFISLDKFLELRKEDAFVEWEEVYPGRYYGTLKSEVDRILAAGKYPLFDVDVKGGLHIKNLYGERAVAIFIQPPSREILKDRLIKRGTDSLAEIERRYEKAAYELTFAKAFDHIVLNDELAEAVNQLTVIIDKYLIAV